MHAAPSPRLRFVRALRPGRAGAPLRLTLALAVAGLGGALPGARAADAPAAPKPPTTPLPAFENPLHDAEIGETCLYKVREPGKDDGWVRYFEERVLARRRVDGEERVLVETIETDATGTKEFSVVSDASRWRDGSPTLVLPPNARFLKDREREEVLLVGGPPETHAVRTVRRVVEYPTRHDQPDGPKTQLTIWFSHDVPVLGRAKQFPAVRNGERVVVSWEKRLPADVCAARAEGYRDEEMLAKERERKKKEAEEKEGQKGKEGGKEGDGATPSDPPKEEPKDPPKDGSGDAGGKQQAA